MMPESTLETPDGVTPPASQPEKSAPDTPRKSDPEQSDGDKKSEVFSREYVEELRKENANRRKEASALEKRLAEIENATKAADEKKLADDSKWQELADKRAKELEAERTKFQQERLDLLRGNIAARYESRLQKSDNPDIDPVTEFAKRLQGSTEDELRADAEKLFAILTPKQAEQTQPQAGSRTQTTIAPDGRPVGETDDQRRSRLYKQGHQNSPLWKPNE